jgi:hypothetical protein
MTFIAQIGPPFFAAAKMEGTAHEFTSPRIRLCRQSRSILA